MNENRSYVNGTIDSILKQLETTADILWKQQDIINKQQEEINQLKQQVEQLNKLLPKQNEEGSR